VLSKALTRLWYYAANARRESQIALCRLSHAQGGCFYIFTQGSNSQGCSVASPAGVYVWTEMRAITTGSFDYTGGMRNMMLGCGLLLGSKKIIERGACSIRILVLTLQSVLMWVVQEQMIACTVWSVLLKICAQISCLHCEQNVLETRRFYVLVATHHS
jgi:hypothetical protein